MQFSKEQEAALQAMRAGKNVFISGEGGTGKSFTVREFCKTKKGCVMLAPTGVAAININGITLHSFFHLPIGLLSTESISEILDDIDGNHPNKDSFSSFSANVIGRLQEQLQNITTIVIDEISMVRSDIFQTIDQLLQLACGNDLPFGGLQIILTGDFFQLPPVSTCSIENDYLKSAYGGIYAFQTMAWYHGNFQNIFLRHNFRQEENKEDLFLSILRSLRRAGRRALSNIDVLRAANHAIEQLNIACFSEKKTTISKSAHVICTDNETANDINLQKLNELHSEQYIANAIIKGEYPESEYPTQKQLCLKIGAKVMLLKNDKRNGYVNGDFGEIQEIAQSRHHTPLFKIKLERSNQLIGVSYPHLWEYSDYYLEPKDSIPKQRILGTFKQYPIRLAYASTVHKSQGRTLDSVCLIKGEKGFFASGQLYTALSRCRTISGLHLHDKITLEDVIVDDAVVDFYRQFDGTK